MGALGARETVRRRVSGRHEGTLSHRAARHRQDAHRRRRPARRRRRRSSVRGLFYDVRDLLRVIRSTYNPVVRTAEMDILRPVMDAELLVLDDLGAEKPSEWVEETINLIVNTRYNERRPTIFTTNFEDVPDETDLDSLRVRVGLPAALPPARDVRLSGVRRRRLPHAARPTAAPTTWRTLWKKGRGRRPLPVAHPQPGPSPASRAQRAELARRQGGTRVNRRSSSAD